MIPIENQYQKTCENNLKDIHENTLVMLNKQIKQYDAVLRNHGKWSYLGSYLLYSNRGNSFYDVYQIDYKISGKNVTYYGGVAYNNIKIKASCMTREGKKRERQVTGWEKTFLADLMDMDWSHNL